MHGVGRRSWLGAAAAGAVALALCLGPSGLVGCLSPTIPIPPPALPSVAAGSAAGYVRLSSTKGVSPNAVIVVYNLRNAAIDPSERVGGAQADAEGSWSTEMRADSGDVLDVVQEVDGTRSPSVNVRVP